MQAKKNIYIKEENPRRQGRGKDSRTVGLSDLDAASDAINSKSNGGTTKQIGAASIMSPAIHQTGPDSDSDSSSKNTKKNGGKTRKENKNRPRSRELMRAGEHVASGRGSGPSPSRWPDVLTCICLIELYCAAPRMILRSLRSPASRRGTIGPRDTHPTHKERLGSRK